MTEIEIQEQKYSETLLHTHIHTHIHTHKHTQTP